MKITFCGAAGEVTGSCTLIDTGKTRVLVDCGMIQGENSYARNFAPFPFDPGSVDAVIVTHAHIDHIGRLPKLVKEGFTGRIFATQPTRLLTRLMLQDAAHVMKDEARRYDRPALYRPNELGATNDLMHGMDYDVEVRVSDDFSFRLREAGHIFGSAFVDIEAGGKKIVFSGDLGNDQVPILRGTANLIDADVVVMEGTYGDRLHDAPEERSRRLADAVRAAIDRKGTLLIPAFSLERTQEILYELNGLVENKLIPPVPFYLDSPLAIKVLPIYKEFSKYYNSEAASLKNSGDDFFVFPGLHITKSPDESRAIEDTPSPKVIIAGSGMMHGGRIMHHLACYLDDPKTSVLVIGFQSAGTVGRKISEGADHVTIDHVPMEVRASVDIISAYSAHADQAKLMRWVTSGKTEPKVFINHSEPKSAEVLAEKLRKEKLLEVIVAEPAKPYEI